MIVRVPGRKRSRRDPFLIVGAIFLVLLVAFAIVGPSVRDAQLHSLSKHQPFTSVYDDVAKPFLNAGGHFPLGTDPQGRDVVARIAAGARISLTVGLVVQLFALVVGVTVGVLGVFAPRWIAGPVMRLTDAMFAFPDILLAILIIGAIQSSKVQVPGGKLAPVIAALSITAWPSIARLVRSQVATLKDREFVVAAKATGASTFYNVTRHILPQLAGILMAVSMIEIAGTILAESTLSFLGIGIQAPEPSWGSMINSARENMNSFPEQLIPPCVVLSLTVFALNFVGDGLRSYLDPKEGK
ncbi:ABC transporter permease [Fimbriimonas ginsengisoli]|uniref:Oligopeptide ABC transporter permease protein n=1 Tax=Fimbriimonas ginsengisoli Gsoil 348 TaxID=661478 RepID=A0A068NJ56_FIMGI|nr:ABC transporter permease [Fimbriimonas ginsengisoli]AIE83492.1 oligopeptide ABC transporter permease protein [Fimbriimonas ginsengisoli Gsoil 348]